MNYGFQNGVGVDIGGTKLLIRYRDQFVLHPTGPDFTAVSLTSTLQHFLSDLENPQLTLGIAVPGLVDEHGTITACDVLPNLKGWHAAKELDRLRVRPLVVNDAKAALYATTADLEPSQVAVTVMVGTAVGCGVRAEGGVLRGASGWAGELGYWPVCINGVWTRLDAIAGGQAMADRVGLDGQSLYAAVLAGDPRATAVVQEGGEALGAALAGLVNLLNPCRLTVGGGALRLPGYWEATETMLMDLALPSLLEACDVVRVDQVHDIVAKGAMLMALEEPRP